MRPTGWVTTAAFRRAAVLPAALCLLAVALGRPDLLAVAVPFALGTLLSLRSRPARAPETLLTLTGDTVTEGGTLTGAVTVAADPGTICVVVPAADPALGVESRPVVAGVPAGVSARVTAVAGTTGTAGTAGTAAETGGPAGAARTAAVPLSGTARRWGVHTFGPVRVRVFACDGLLEFPEQTPPPKLVRALPAAEPYSSRTPVPRPGGISGLHRSRRPGDGGELAGVRPYRPGDRLRRIDWRVTLRAREPYVNATQPDRDAEIVILLDVLRDVGGGPGAPGVLDAAVRAAAAIAGHYTHQGDQVSLVEFGPRLRRLRPGTGRRHHLAQLAWLTETRPMPGGQEALGDRLLAIGMLPPGALIVMLTPLLDPRSATALAVLARARRAVVAVDTLPEGLPLRSTGEWAEPAERIWRLERDNTVGRLREAGVPVEPWRGSGSLDAVLRDVARAAAVMR
ncbi:hypothetical protein GCM10010156_73270 [Planobispora rosea]|uniref:DUF58 domain-containing protein n=1 Tax=Planobispora rosea TaxID=35762 RepID=A0A8J3WGV4_PLARO|nr:DUF58 domain-containing protein [Planobispora rosea]GGT04850.1 hypothetical protein GCM10010156_73270 [Planobispora rosea]GIH88925.1 hypothetical protein Pro02_73330 [Planobispora rosea]